MKVLIVFVALFSIALAIDGAEDNGIISDQCKETFKQCRELASGIVDRLKCDVSLGLCLAASITKCGEKCIGELVHCRIAAVKALDFSALIQCEYDFIACLRGNCSTDAPVTALETADNGIIDEHCRKMFTGCRSLAQSIMDRLQCDINLGLCLAASLTKCGQKCIPPLVVCKIAAMKAMDFQALLQCSKDFLTCLRGNCTKDLTLIKENPDNGIISDLCKKTFSSCREMATSIFQRLQCDVQFGLCLGAQAANCSKKCIPPLVKCQIDATKSLDFQAFIQCSKDFITCIIGGCTYFNEEPMAIDYSPYQAAVDATAMEETDVNVLESVAECQEANKKCVAAAGHNFPAKAKCFLTFGWCVARESMGCAKACIPGMVMCLAGAAGNWFKTFLCATNFINCARKECGKLVALPAVVSTTEVGEPNGEIQKLAACLSAMATCLGGATGLPSKVHCYLTCGYCITKDLAICSAPCMPSMAICMMGASGNWLKTLICGKTFISCAKDKCIG